MISVTRRIGSLDFLELNDYPHTIMKQKHHRMKGELHEVE